MMSALTGPRRWRTLDTVVLCEFHGEVHRRDRNPHDMADDHGRPIDECGPDVWRNVAALGTEEELDGY